MAYDSFSAFIAALESAGELKRLRFPVATELEITEIADREMKSPGGESAALRATHGERQGLVVSAGHQYNGLAAAHGAGAGPRSCGRLDAADGADLEGKPPTSLKHAWTLAMQGLDLLNAKPKHVRSGACKEMVHRFDHETKGVHSSIGNLPTLLDLPILKCWPQDGGRFITLPCVHTRDPDTGERNLGMYRMQIYDDRTSGMHWQVHKVGARHGRRYYEKGERMPVAVTLGGDPAYTFAATAPLPDGLDEILFADSSARNPWNW